MISGPARSGSLYWLTSVPHTPATSTRISAASGGMSGRSISRSSVVDAATFNAASTFSDTQRTSLSSPPAADRRGTLRPYRGTCQRAAGQDRPETRVGLLHVALEQLAAIVVAQPGERVHA